MSVQGGGFRGRLRARSAGKVLAAGIAVVLGFGPAAADRLLFIGNSYLQDGGGVHVHAAALASSAAPERRIEVAASTFRGSRVDEQDISATLARAPYDTVVLQGHSTAALTEAARERFRTAVRRAHREIAAKGGQTVLYMTPAYSAAHPRHDTDMISRIATEYTDLGRELGASVIPGGLAYESASARRPDIALHKPDGSHATVRGIYLAAATTAAALFGIDPRAAAYAMDGAIALEDADFLRTVAADAVRQAQSCTQQGRVMERVWTGDDLSGNGMATPIQC